ncbi:MAG: DUF4347 domain-containing protein [Trichodesmium sp. MO_231.B1]|nr:DUF4347 domain-containing protein [Trichodesmium sp. MO_231.B1]
MTKSILFIDPNVEDYQILVRGTNPNIKIVILDTYRDTIQQITETLLRNRGVKTVHIVSHGAPGCLYLGNSQLNINSINNDYAQELEAWSVTNILLYGCNVAAGDTGTEFLEKLQQLTGANIAATARRTGNVALGGDWELEVIRGELEVDIPFTQDTQQQWNYVLDPFEEKPALFQVISGVLFQLNPLTGGYEEIGGTGDPIYNAAGYNRNDNYIYGFEISNSNQKLLRIDSTGTVEYVKNDGTVTTDENDSDIFTINISPNPTAGDIDRDNNLWITNLTNKTSILRINLDNPVTATTINLTGTTPSGNMPADLTYVDHQNSFYGISSDGELVTIDISDINNTTISTSNTINIDGGGNLGAELYGAAWTDGEGKLYVSANTGQLYHIRDFDSAPVAEELLPTEATNSNDGISDPWLTSVFDIPLIDLDGTDTPGTNYETTFTENGGAVNIVDITDGETTTDGVLTTNGLIIRDYINNGTTADGDRLQEATITLTNPLNGDDEKFLVDGVELTDSATVPGTNITATVTTNVDGEKVVTLTPTTGETASVDDFETALKDIQYENTSENPDTTDRTLQIVLTDENRHKSFDILGPDGNEVNTTIQVTSVNDPPVADNESFTMNENDSSITLNLLDGDTDPDGDDNNLSIKSINGTDLTPPTAQTITVPNGTVNVTPDGTITFTPDADFNGDISFDYVVQDENGGEDTGTVVGTVNPVNNNQEENTTLNPGDIAFVQYNADGTDNFKFVALVDIPASEEIKFTDKGWLGDNSGFRTSEGIVTWTAPAGGISAGTVVEINDTPSASVGTVSGSSLNFAATGDQIIAYQGTNTPIAALNNEGAATWQADATSTSTSALPQGLVNGTNAVAINEIDNAIYTGITTGDKATLLAAINNSANWTGSNSANQNFTGNFTIGSGGNSTPPTVEYQLEVAQNIGGSGSDQGLGIATDSNGNVWTTGFFEGSIDIDSDGNNDLTSNGEEDGYIAKFDSSGNLLFSQNIGGSGSDHGFGINIDSNGNVWATGEFQGSIDIDSDGNNDLTSNGLSDSYLAKFDSNGNLLFAENIGGSSNEGGYGIATDSNGNVWATGFFFGSIDINGDGNNDLIGNGSFDSYVAKFDNNGDLVFAQNIGGGSTDWGYGIATDSDGNVWATGYFSGSIDIDSDGDNDLTSSGSEDSYIAKFDSNGDLVFAQNIGGSSNDFGRGIAIDSNGNVWVTGYFQGSIDIDSDGDNDLTSSGSEDSYIAKFDSNGDLVFAQNIGGGSTDHGYGIATDSNDNVWATGFFRGSIDIDSDGNNDLTSQNGSSDSYVAKFDSNGNLLFAQNISGGSTNIGFGIATDSNGNVWTTGYFSGSIDIDSDGNNDLSNNGGWDSYIVKFSPVSPQDTTSPTATSFTPADNTTDIAIGEDLVIDFDENIQANTGNIVIKQFSDNSIVETINVTSGQVTISNNTLTIDPTADLAAGTEYYVEIASGAIEDTAGNDYAGISDVTTWNFTTVSSNEPVEFDFNGDSKADILWRNDTTGDNQIWATNPTNIQGLPVRSSDWSLHQIGNFDNDTSMEILWRNSTSGENQIWNVDGTTEVSGLPTRSSQWQPLQVGDFDGDNIDELLWRNTNSGVNQIWDVDGTTQVSGLLTRNNNWTPVAVGDFDGDNIDELLWRNNSTGQNQIWNVDGTTQVRGLPNRSSNWEVAQVGDFDGDNIDELLWRNNSTGQNQIWNVDGTTQTKGLPNRSSNWELAQVGDFDGDNIDELLWRNNSTGQNQLWNVDGTTQVRGLPNRSSNWEVAQAGDFDSDNIDELLWRNNNNGQNQLWNVDGSVGISGISSQVADWQVI